MITQVREYLSKEATLLNRKEKWIFIFSTGAFVSFFLLFFQPFGVNNYNPNETITPLFLLLMIVMGVVVIILMAISEFFIFYVISSKISQRKDMLVWILWSLVWTCTGVFLFYNYLGNWHDFTVASYFQFFGNLSMMALLPLASLLIYIRNRELKKSLEKAHSYSYGDLDGDYLLVFQADNFKDQFTLPLKYLVYIESEDNYVAIHHLSQGLKSRKLLRKSLKSIEEESLHPALVRCHRSFTINLMHLQKIQGNRNKLELYLDQMDKPIPVSRNYTDQIYKLIKR